MKKFYEVKTLVGTATVSYDKEEDKFFYIKQNNVDLIAVFGKNYEETNKEITGDLALSLLRSLHIDD